MNLAKCFDCDLCMARKNIVNGEGNIKAPILFLGEAPGYNEDKLGRPFVGDAGKQLDYFLNLFGLTREYHVFITNTVLCRPPNNREPHPIEISICSIHVSEEILMVNPKIIVLLGNTALKTTTGIYWLNISKARGKWFTAGKFKNVIATYHPSAVLRNKQLKAQMFSDFEKIIIKYRELCNPIHKVNY